MNEIDKDGTNEVWIKDLRTAVSASQKNFHTPRDSPQLTVNPPGLNTARNKKEANNASQTSLMFNKKPINKRFIFSSHKGTRTSNHVNLPPKNEIPVICIDREDEANEEIRVKPMFSAKRIDSASSAARSIQP